MASFFTGYSDVSVVYWMSIIWIVLLFAVNKIIYSSFSFSSDNRAEQKNQSVFFNYSFAICNMTLVGMLVLAAVSPKFYFHTAFEQSSIMGLGSLIIGVLGIAVLFKGRKDLGEFYSDCGNAFIPEGLRTDGIYAYIRHPIYSGNLLLCYSAFLVLPNYLSMFVCFLLTVSYAVSIPREEESLCEEFSTYRKYQKLTGRVLPRIVVSSYSEKTVSTQGKVLTKSLTMAVETKRLSPW